MEHHVYFWLNEDRLSEADCEAFEAGLEALCQSENIASSRWGKPAATSERPVTDHSWNYGISLKFDSMEFVLNDWYHKNDNTKCLKHFKLNA